MRQAFISRLVHGVSIIGIGLPGNLESPATPGKPEYVSDVPWPWISKLAVDLEPGSETYGKVVTVILNRPTGNQEGEQLQTETVKLHVTRFVHWVNPDLDSTNPMGMSALLPLADMLTVKKNVDWSTGEILYQYGNKHYVFQFPPTMPDDQYVKAKAQLVDFNALSSFV